MSDPKSQNNVIAGTRKRSPARRCWVITEFDTAKFKEWKSLDVLDLGIRYFVYQLETAPETGRLHIQGYIEFYKQVRLTTVKRRLASSKVHAEQRKGSRNQARDYCLKDDSPWFQANHPDWIEKGSRVQSTQPVELGVWATRQGHRVDPMGVADLIKSGATESQIFEKAPVQYLKFSNGIRRARHLQTMKNVGKFMNVKVHVVWGATRSKKTSWVKERCGLENIYEPAWNGSKYWFTDYDGQSVLLINEFYGQAKASYMQNLLDVYSQRLDGKCTNPISNWTDVYITSNCHPREWYNSWANIPNSVVDSFVERFASITHRKTPKHRRRARKTWADVPALEQPEKLSWEAPSITLPTSEATDALLAPPVADPAPPSNPLPNPTSESPKSRGSIPRLARHSVCSSPEWLAANALGDFDAANAARINLA